MHIQTDIHRSVCKYKYTYTAQYVYMFGFKFNPESALTPKDPNAKPKDPKNKASISVNRGGPWALGYLKMPLPRALGSLFDGLSSILKCLYMALAYRGGGAVRSSQGSNGTEAADIFFARCATADRSYSKHNVDK